MKVYEFRQFGLENLVAGERAEVRAVAGEVVVKFHAASLNFRDVMFAQGVYNPRATFPAIPLSDGAGDVVEVGEGVTRWRVGDRVCPIFMQGWVEGPATAEKNKTSLGGGGEYDGVLRERGVFQEEALVRIPEHLSYEEAATLPCAAVTAWHALSVFGKVQAGETVLTMGTGGVSIFALQFAKAAGARVIATSSDEAKLARLREMGADEVINYRKTPDWEKEVLRLTDGVGVDHVVEIGGAGTLNQSVASARVGGKVGLIGVLTEGAFNPTAVLMKSVTLQGIFVGSREMFEGMNRAIAVNKLKPVIDRVFGFDEVRAALEHMASGKHFGKIVIKY
jgi:NADPH:quinone reductase-like Zn-dependent oxidoreductase